MTTITEFLELLGECVRYLAISNGVKFVLAVVIGLLLGAAGYWLTSTASTLWNKSYHLRAGHHLLCTAAAIITAVFALVYVSVDFIGQAAKFKIHAWRDDVMADNEWHQEMFNRAFDAIAKSGIEDMTGVGNPRVDLNVTIPIHKWESRILLAQVFSQGALQDFRQKHPFLDSALHPGSQAPEEEIKDDLVNFFKSDPAAKIYPSQRAVTLATGYLESLAQEQLPGVGIYTSRIILALFVMLQIFVFAVISIASHRSLTATV